MPVSAVFGGARCRLATRRCTPLPSSCTLLESPFPPHRPAAALEEASPLSLVALGEFRLPAAVGTQSAVLPPRTCRRPAPHSLPIPPPLSLARNPAPGDAARLAEVLTAGAPLEVKDDPCGSDSSGRLARLRRLLEEMSGANLDSERDAAALGEEEDVLRGGEAAATEDESDWETASVQDLETVEEEGGEEEPEGSASGSEHGSAPGGPEAGSALHRMESLLAGRRRAVTGTPLHLAAANSITSCIPVRKKHGSQRGCGVRACSSPAQATHAGALASPAGTASLRACATWQLMPFTPATATSVSMCCTGAAGGG